MGGVIQSVINFITYIKILPCLCLYICICFCLCICLNILGWIQPWQVPHLRSRRPCPCQIMQMCPCKMDWVNQSCNILNIFSIILQMLCEKLNYFREKKLIIRFLKISPESLSVLGCHVADNGETVFWPLCHTYDFFSGLFVIPMISFLGTLS